MAALALTTDTSVLTSIANDYDFTRVFARQIEALGRPGDVAFGISTSGRSANVVAAFAAAKARGLRTIALIVREARCDDHDTGGRRAKRDQRPEVHVDLNPLAGRRPTRSGALVQHSAGAVMRPRQPLVIGTVTVAESVVAFPQSSVTW